MPTDTPWTRTVQQATDHLAALHTTLQQAPIQDRLAGLAALDRSYTDLRHRAQHEAVTAARQQGWPLRRIATALDCSHEQVRHLTT